MFAIMLSGDYVQYVQLGSCVCVSLENKIKGINWRLVAVKGKDSRELEKAWCLSGKEYLRERQTFPRLQRKQAKSSLGSRKGY